MTTRRVEDVGLQIRSVLAFGSASSLTDGQLLARFAGGDPATSGLAFEVLVERHGPMVLRVCRGVLCDSHDAQDAFQATFLVLVRRAGSIRDRDSVASWLHGVALRVASHARADAARRRRLERAASRAESESEPQASPAADLGPRLHEEVGRLSDRHRAAVVLCYLEGHTCEDAARVLGWPVGTVKSRLSRARERLRVRLSRTSTPLVLPIDDSCPMIPPLSPGLARSTATLAARFAAGSPSVSAASSLAEGALKTMTLAKWKYAASALLAAASWPVIASALAPTPVDPDPPMQLPSPQSQVVQPKTKVEAPDPVALTTPRQLDAQAGSGMARVYALDANSERIPADDDQKAIFERREKAIDKAGDAPEALKAALALPVGLWKEVNAPLRWVVITGVVDNQAVRNALARWVEPAKAFPNYKRLDIERQVRQPDGTWSDWSLIDRTKDYDVLDNMPELAKERLPQEVRPEALVDQLPILRDASWAHVDPESVLRLPKPEPVRQSLFRSPLLALRVLNFAIEPGETYRYRLCVVLVNSPELARSQKDVVQELPDAPAILTDAMKRKAIAQKEAGFVPRELPGPWSEPTGAVTVP